MSIAGNKYTLNVLAGKKIRFKADFFADYEEVLHCIDSYDGQDIWKNRLWPHSNAVTEQVIGPVAGDRTLTFYGQHKECYYQNNDCSTYPWLDSPMKVVEETSTRINLQWSDGADATVRNIGVIIDIE
jgi:hypothetical protein